MGEMGKFIASVLMVSVLFISYSCNKAGTKAGKENTVENKITQAPDGTISLGIEKAQCYNNAVDPSNNTAEWNFVVEKPGRYDVWVSSLTKDTMDLQYANSVKVNLQDVRLEAKPIGNKIVEDAKDVHYPYFRADSYMGTFYFNEPGEYSIQLISEKVIQKDSNLSALNDIDHTKLVSVILTPMVR